MPNAPRGGAVAGSPTWSDDADVEVDMGGLDMFNRQSIAMFERYNKEQVCIELNNTVYNIYL